MFFRFKEGLLFIVGLLVLSISLILILRLWDANFSVPFSYAGDSLSASMTIKTVMDYDWYIVNPALGAPFELNMNEYPLGGDNFNYLLIKIISLFSNEYAVVVNVFHVLTYYLTFGTAYFAFRYFKIHPVFCIGGALLFSLMPYHFFRGMGGHLFLICYYIIPLVLLVCYWIMNNKVQLTSKSRFLDNRARNITSLLTAILIASTGIYYAFFAVFFWVVSALYLFINSKDKKVLFTSAILICITAITLVINFSPTILYKIKYGSNQDAVQRSIFESEILSLKINQIFMPMIGHRFQPFNVIAEKYSMSPLFNENHSVSLGMLGSIGFIVLLILLLVRHKLKNENLSILQNMSIINLSALLLSVTGGIGFFVAALLTSSIRGYNRIIPYIGFISYLTIIILIQMLFMHIRNKKISYVFLIFTCFIFILGIWDQTSDRYIPNYQANNQEFTDDKAFFNEIVDNVPLGSKIFQLPYVPFPENPWVYRMGNYEHLKGYLHTSSLHWSFGALKGSSSDLWIKDVSEKPISDMLETLVFAKFEGVYLDRFGYPESDHTIEEEIIKLTNTKPLVSKNGRWVFINLADYNKKVKNNYTLEEFKNKSYEVLHPLLISWGKGIYDEEKSSDNSNYWRWFDESGTINLYNTSNIPKKIHLEASIISGGEEEFTLYVNSSFYNEEVNINSNENHISKDFILPPGKHKLILKSNTQKLYAPNDPRELYFRMERYAITELN